MDIIKAKHSIRKYTGEQIPGEALEQILEAGNYAPNAGGGQRSMLVAIHNKELTTRVGKMNLAHFDRTHLAGNYVSKEQPSTIDDPTIRNGFYDAPTVVCVFCQDNFLFKTADAFCMMENMILQATELGLLPVSYPEVLRPLPRKRANSLCMTGKCPKGIPVRAL